MTDETTCWTLIDAAAMGGTDDREEFARRYLGPVHAYLVARWRNLPYLQYVDDAVQEVFLQCFREGGPLERVDHRRAGGFRAYLYGIVRNIARSFERRDAAEQRSSDGNEIDLEQVVSDESSLSVVYDRAWAKCIMQLAARQQLDRAQEMGPDAVQRVELLRLRFHEGLPIRKIARRWLVDSTKLHREYAKARKEFKTALLEVIAFHYPGSPADVEREYAELLASLE